MTKGQGTKLPFNHTPHPLLIIVTAVLVLCSWIMEKVEVRLELKGTKMSIAA
jgi:hypothetical protein